MARRPRTIPNFGWRPRTFLEVETAFGKVYGVQWKDPLTVTRTDDVTDEQQQARALAARWQHEVAAAVHDGRALQGMTIEEVAEHTRMGVDNLSRLLRGDGPMQVEDFAALSRLFGFGIEIRNDEAPRRAGANVDRDHR